MAESAFRNNLFISFYIAKMPFMTVTGMAEISKLWVMYCSWEKHYWGRGNPSI